MPKDPNWKKMKKQVVDLAERKHALDDRATALDRRAKELDNQAKKLDGIATKLARREKDLPETERIQDGFQRREQNMISGEKALDEMSVDLLAREKAVEEREATLELVKTSVSGVSRADRFDVPKALEEMNLEELREVAAALEADFREIGVEVEIRAGSKDELRGEIIAARAALEAKRSES